MSTGSSSSKPPMRLRPTSDGMPMPFTSWPNGPMSIYGVPRPIVGSAGSTVGPLVASELGAEWVDLDREIEVRAGLTVSKIFATDGEEHFRALEQRHMMELLQGTN